MRRKPSNADARNDAAVSSHRRGRVLVLDVTFFEDAAEGVAESLRALRPRGRRAADIEVRTINADTARQLLTWPMLALLRAIRSRRPASLTALAEAVGRDAAGVRGDLRLLEQAGVIALRDAGRAGGPLRPTLLYEEIRLRVRP